MTRPRRRPIAGWLPWVVLLMGLGAALRLVNLGAPPLDFQPTRQLRNALVARAIYYAGSPLAEPASVDLAESFRRAVGQYEPPIFESLVGWTFVIIGGESFAVPRIYGTVFWLLAAIALFSIARRAVSPRAAILSLAYFLVLPFGVQASRSFQPDPLMTAALVLSMYFLMRWAEKPAWKWAIAGAAVGAFAVLVKVVIAFVLAGIAVALVLSTLGRRFRKSPQVWVMAMVMIAPAALYYLIANPARSTEYFFAWTLDLIGLISSIHFYADWLGFVGSLMGLTFLLLAGLGTFMAPPRLRWLLAGSIAGYLLYGLALPFQMYTHSYYHLQLIPLIALGLAPLANIVLEKMKDLSDGWRYASLLIVILFIGYEAWAARSVLVAEDFSAEPAFWRDVGDAIPRDAEVIALTQNYGFDLMYWGWRRARLWPLSTALSDLRAGDRGVGARFPALTQGMDYFLVTAFGQLERQPELRSILERFPIAAQGDGFVLYDLNASE